jgi:hypothetical protein
MLEATQETSRFGLLVRVIMNERGGIIIPDGGISVIF